VIASALLIILILGLLWWSQSKEVALITDSEARSEIFKFQAKQRAWIAFLVLLAIDVPWELSIIMRRPRIPQGIFAGKE